MKSLKCLILKFYLYFQIVDQRQPFRERKVGPSSNIFGTTWAYIYSN